jgi:hypothetical protein
MKRGAIMADCTAALVGRVAAHLTVRKRHARSALMLDALTANLDESHAASSAATCSALKAHRSQLHRHLHKLSTDLALTVESSDEAAAIAMGELAEAAERARTSHGLPTQHVPSAPLAS